VPTRCMRPRESVSEDCGVSTWTARCSPVQGEQVGDAVVAHVVETALVLHVLDEHAELRAPVTLHNIRPGQCARRMLTDDNIDRTPHEPEC